MKPIPIRAQTLDHIIELLLLDSFEEALRDYCSRLKDRNGHREFSHHRSILLRRIACGLKTCRRIAEAYADVDYALYHPLETECKQPIKGFCKCA